MGGDKGGRVQHHLASSDLSQSTWDLGLPFVSLTNRPLAAGGSSIPLHVTNVQPRDRLWEQETGREGRGDQLLTMPGPCATWVKACSAFALLMKGWILSAV